MKKIVIGILSLIAVFLGWSHFTEAPGIGADTVTPIAGQTYTLAGSGISSTATSFTLSSFTITQNGYKIQDSDMSEVFYVTFEPGSRSRQEIASCTTVVQNANDTATISGCTRGLSPITPYTASSSLQFAHGGGTSVIFSNPPQLYNQAAFKDNDETITGSWLFPTPLSDSNAATKTYVDNLVNGGTVSNDRLVVAGNAGATIATGTLVYFNGTDQEWYTVDTDDTTTYQDKFIGLSQGAGTDGAAFAGGVLLKGRDTTQTGLTPGAVYYASSSAGVIDTATTSQPVGIAVDTDILYFDPILVDIPRLSNNNIWTGENTFNGFVNFAGTTTVRIYTATSSTWTKPDNLRYISVWVCGAGGNGSPGNSASDGGGGGGGGGCGYELLDADELTATTSVTVTVGTTVGGSSSFGNFCTATGGTSGTIPTQGTGGTATGCDLNLSGQDGRPSDTAASGNNIFGGDGGSSYLGQGGYGGSGDGGNGGAAKNYGAGGGGGGADDNSTSSGGAFAPGVVIITEYY